MIDYHEVVRNGRECAIYKKHHKWGCREYIYKGVRYLLKDNKILCRGNCLFLYINGDYRYFDENNCCILMRGDKVLYKTKPYQEIFSNSPNNPTNSNYRVEDGKVTKELHFPFNISLLSIIDETLKGEQWN